MSGLRLGGCLAPGIGAVCQYAFRQQAGRRIANSSVANAAQELKKKFIEHVMSNTEDVGRRFPRKRAGSIYKEAPERAIRGIASGQEVGEFKEEGIDVMAIPGTPALPEKLH